MAEKVSAAPERPGGTGHVDSSCSGSSSGSETLSEEGEPGGGRVAAAPGAGEAAGRLRPGEEQASPGGRPKDDASLEERDEEVRGAGAAALSSPARRHRAEPGAPARGGPPGVGGGSGPPAGSSFMLTWVLPLRVISPSKHGAFLFRLPRLSLLLAADTGDFCMEGVFFFCFKKPCFF